MPSGSSSPASTACSAPGKVGMTTAGSSTTHAAARSGSVRRGRTRERSKRQVRPRPIEKIERSAAHPFRPPPSSTHDMLTCRIVALPPRARVCVPCSELRPARRHRCVRAAWALHGCPSCRCAVPARTALLLVLRAVRCAPSSSAARLDPHRLAEVVGFAAAGCDRAL